MGTGTNQGVGTKLIPNENEKQKAGNGTGRDYQEGEEIIKVVAYRRGASTDL